MARILRGEIRWANLNPTQGHEQSGFRPILILSNDVFNERMQMVIAVALTSKQPRFGFPLTLELDSDELPQKTWILMGQIRTLSIKRIGKRLGNISVEQINQVIEGINEIIGTYYPEHLIDDIFKQPRSARVLRESRNGQRRGSAESNANRIGRCRSIRLGRPDGGGRRRWS